MPVIGRWAHGLPFSEGSHSYCESSFKRLTPINNIHIPITHMHTVMRSTAQTQVSLYNPYKTQSTHSRDSSSTWACSSLISPPAWISFSVCSSRMVLSISCFSAWAWRGVQVSAQGQRGSCLVIHVQVSALHLLLMGVGKRHKTANASNETT